MGYPGEQRTHRPPYLHQAGRPDGDPWQAGGGSWPPYAGHGRREDAPRRDAVPYGPEPGPTPQAGPYGWETGPTLQGAMPYRPDPGHTPPGGPYGPEPSHTPQAGPYGPEPGHTPQGGPYALDTGHAPLGRAHGPEPGGTPQGAAPHQPEPGPGPGGPGPGEESPSRRDEQSRTAPGRRQRPAEQAEPAWDPDARGPQWIKPLILTGGVMALIGALFFGLWTAAKNEKPAAPVATPKPSSSLPSFPTGKYGFAASRKTDKTPLTVKELFGKAKFATKGRGYVRTVWRKEKRCEDGVNGDKIKKALRSGRCTQLIRASFRDTKNKIIGTVGVANLATSAAAKKVATAGGGKEREDYLKPLPGKDEATKQLGNGDAYAGGWTYGHYAVLLWFQFKDGHKPNKNELKQLYRAANDIADQTVFPALEHRSLTGGRRA